MGKWLLCFLIYRPCTFTKFYVTKCVQYLPEVLLLVNKTLDRMTFDYYLIATFHILGKTMMAIDGELKGA